MSLTEMKKDVSFLKDLNPAQREAVAHGAGPLLIVAGAGSGKTRVITYRIAHLLNQGVNPWNILAVTFTNKAAEEMRHRVDKLVPGPGREVWISTFHSFCAKVLRMEARALGLDPHFLIYDDQDQTTLLKGIVRELELDEKRFKPQMLISMISGAKDNLLDAKSYEIHSLASSDTFRAAVSKVYTLYEQKLQASGALDFGDLILKLTEALRNDEVLRAKYNQRFRHLLVDEYQDTNRAQYFLTKCLAGTEKNICIVGDPDQSIYSWRGADIRNILEFEKDYGGAKVVKLEQNYRSTPNILSAASQLIRHNRARHEKELWTERAAGSPIAVQELASEMEEAYFVANEIQRIVREGGRLSDCAIFYRTNAQSRAFEDALRRSELPYRLIGTVRFYERAEIKDLMAYMRLIVNPKDSLSFKRIVNVPGRGLGKTSIEALEKFAATEKIPLYETLGSLDAVSGLTPRAKASLREFHKLMEELRADRDTVSAVAMTKLILNATRYIEVLEEEDTPEAEARVDNLKELVNAVAEFEERSPDKSVTGFLEQISLLSDLDNMEDSDRVTLMTLHLAKGLEFSAAFVTGLEEGLFPIGDSAYSPEELEEERRLCYVGMTRAKDQLIVTYAASRRLYGQAHWNMPSRFLEEAGLKVAQPTPQEHASLQHEHTVSGFTVGMRVRHPDFGNGKIVEKTGSGEDLKVVVHFTSGQWKKLMVRYANLERV